jgi:hypothetical protein
VILEDFRKPGARAIIGTPLWRDMRMLLIGCYMDGFAIGYKGREIRYEYGDGEHG